MRKKLAIIACLIVLIAGGAAIGLYGNRIEAIEIYKQGTVGWERAGTVERQPEHQALFKSLEASFRRLQKADPKADANIESPVYRLEVKGDTMQLRWKFGFPAIKSQSIRATVTKK